jgi:hypothetical protein
VGASPREPGISLRHNIEIPGLRPKGGASRNDHQEHVIAGLDPAIHPKKMDARVKPAHDDWLRGSRN